MTARRGRDLRRHDFGSAAFAAARAARFAATLVTARFPGYRRHHRFGLRLALLLCGRLGRGRDFRIRTAHDRGHVAARRGHNLCR